MNFNRGIFKRVVDALVRTQGYTKEEAWNVYVKLDAITDEEFKNLGDSLRGKGPAEVQAVITEFIRVRIPELES
jgi:hypothetical protein